jgi:hypothetical protein
MHATVDDLRALIERHVILPPDQWRRFEAMLGKRVLRKQRHILQIGQVSGELAFILRGLVRRYALISGRTRRFGRILTAFTWRRVSGWLRLASFTFQVSGYLASAKP